MLGENNIQFIVPSGNFGNLTGGLFAREMGLPFQFFVAANNENDAAVRYMDTAQYTPNQTIPTLSNAMDVGNPSNFVRVLEIFDHDYEAVRDVMQAFKVSDIDTVQTMRSVRYDTGYLLDPHTAVGWHIAEQVDGDDVTQVLIATASPVKFAREIGEATGIAVDDSDEIAALQSRPQRKTAIPNDYSALTALLNGDS